MNLLRNDFMEQIAFEYKTEVTIYSPEFIFPELSEYFRKSVCA